MQKISTTGRSARALIATGVVGAGLVLSGFAGTVAESRPMGSSIIWDPCDPVIVADATQAYYPCDSPTTRNTIPENQTTSTVPRETTTTVPRQTTTTMVRETTTTQVGETTTTAPAETTTTRPGAAAAAAARPVAAQATYTG